jgi:hypothetical protein
VIRAIWSRRPVNMVSDIHLLRGNELHVSLPTKSPDRRTDRLP